MSRAKPRPHLPRLSTLAIHGGRDARKAGDPIVEPLIQSVNHMQALGTAEGLLYTRYGNTPNAERLQKRLALLEGAEAALVLSSGMAATACALLALLRPGDHLISVTDPEGTVSKNHVRHEHSRQRTWVTDQGSTNGTEVLEDDGEVTRLAPHVRTEVPDGARVRMGNRTFTISALLDNQGAGS